MKKKTLLLSGLMCLGIAAGITSYAVAVSSPGINAVAEGEEDEEIPTNYVAPTYVSPEAGAELSGFPGVSEVWLQMPVGDSGLSGFWSDSPTAVVIKRGEEVVFSSSFEQGNKQVYIPTTGYTSRLYIKPDAPLTEAGEYTVSIEAGIVGAESFGQDGASKNVNNEYSWSFTILPALPYTYAPATGETSISRMAHFTLTYPEGTAIKASSVESLQPYLTHFKTGASTKETNYTASISGNVVTLNAVDPAAIQVVTNNNIQAEYSQIVIPAGYLTISNGEIEYKNTEIVVGPYKPIAIAAADLTFTPALDTPGLKITDLQEITVELSEGVEWVQDIAKATAYTNALTIYPDLANTSYYYQFGYTSISDDKRTAILYLKQGTSPTATANNWDLCLTGSTTIRVAANVLATSDGKKNAQIDMKGYTLDGLDYAPIYNTSSPGKNGTTTSISGITLNFLLNTKVINEDADITLSYNGEVVKSVKAGATTTAAAKTATGSKSVAFANLFKNGTANFTAPGEYVFHVPAGTFQMIGHGDYINIDTDIHAYIVQNPVGLGFSPKPATFSGTTSAIVATPSEELTELSTFTVTYPEGTVIELAEGYKNKLGTGGVVTLNGAAVLNNNQSAYATAISGYTFKTVEVDGNKVTFTLAKPYKATQKTNYFPAFMVPAGLMIAHVPNGEGGSDLYANAQMMAYYQQLPMAKGVLSALDRNANGTLNLLPLADDGGFLLSTQMNELIYTAYEGIYAKSPVPTAVLTDESGNVVAEYTGITPDFDDYPGSTQATVLFTTDTDLSDLERGTYTFTIDKETLQAGTSSAAAGAKNLVDYVYELNVLNLEVSESPAQGDVVGPLSKINVHYHDVMVAKVNSELKPMVYVKHQNPLTEEYYNVDITTLGYKVDFKVNGMVVPDDFDPDTYAVSAQADEVDPGYGVNEINADIVISPAYNEAGALYVHLPAGLVLLETVCPTPGLDLEYNIVAPVPFEDVVTLSFPSENEFYLKQTYGAMYGRPYGMAAIELRTAKTVSVDTASDAKVQLYYNDTLISEIGTATPDENGDGTGIHDTTRNIFADGDGLIDLNDSNTFLFMFDPEASDKFKEAGEYSLVIPQGVFVSDGVPVAEGSINYILLPDEVVEDGYSVEPASDTTFYELQGPDTIVLTIDNVSMYLDYMKNPGALYDPDGNSVFITSPKMSYNRSDKKGILTWKLTEKPIEWVKGTYSFVVKANSIGIDAWADEVDPTFPAEDIVITYILDDATSVAVVGLEGADDYTVYTLDGKTVLLNAPAEKLVDLEGGLYIINGKKVKVLK